MKIIVSYICCECGDAFEIRAEATTDYDKPPKLTIEINPIDDVICPFCGNMDVSWSCISRED